MAWRARYSLAGLSAYLLHDHTAGGVSGSKGADYADLPGFEILVVLVISDYRSGGTGIRVFIQDGG